MQNLIEHVLRRAQVKRLRRTSEGWGCCCPFHQESSPSFAVRDNGLWLCYSEMCGRSGNLFKLLTELGGYSAKEAAALAAVPLPSRGTLSWADIPKTLSEARRPRPPPALNETCAAVYSAHCPKYLLDRGFSKSTCSAFEAGYDVDTAQVVLPLRDVFGKLVGLVRRQTSSYARGPRYLVDVPQERRALLFNLFRARHGRRVIVVEGALDAMWLHQHGYTNAVALLGSKLSREQQRILVRYVDEVILMLDNDPAGLAATFRLVDRLAPLLVVRVAASFTHGKDAADQTHEDLTYCLTHTMTAEAWRMCHVFDFPSIPVGI